MSKRALALVLVLALTLSGCVGMTPLQEVYYARWQADPDPPPLKARKKNVVGAFLVGMVFPGVSHFYLGEVGWGFVYMAVGMLVFPWTGSIAAIWDTDTVYRCAIADEYRAIVEERARQLEIERRRRESEQPAVNATR